MRRFSFRPALSFKGRKFRGLRGWSGKPLHPPLTDIPIAAYVIGAGMDVVSYAGNLLLGLDDAPWARDFYRAGTFVLVVGVSFAVLTAATGFADWLDTEPGTQVRRTANAHAWIMIAVTATMLTDVSLRWFRYADEPSTPFVILVASVGAAVLTFVGAAYGGSLIYEYGFNVETAGKHPAWQRSEIDVFPSGPKPSRDTGGNASAGH